MANHNIIPSRNGDPGFRMEYLCAEAIRREYPVYVPWTPSRLPDGSDPNGHVAGKEEWCEACKKCQCVECQLNCTSPKLWMGLCEWAPSDDYCRIACCAVAKFNMDGLQRRVANLAVFSDRTKRRRMMAWRLWRAIKYVTRGLFWAPGNLPDCSRPVVDYCSAKCFGNAFVENCHCVNWDRLKMNRRYVAKNKSSD